VYYCDPTLCRSTFKLSLALAFESRKIHETTGFAASIAGVVIRDDVPMKRALVNLARTVAAKCPMTFIVGHTFTTIAVQAHYWRAWHDLESDWALAIEGNMSHAIYESAMSKRQYRVS